MKQPPQQLSLFGDDAGAAPAVMLPSTAPAVLPPASSSASAATLLAPGPAVHSIPAPPPPVLPRHPLAQHHIVLGGHDLHYHYKRTRRRSIGFAVASEGLTVSAPRWVRMADVEAALRDKERWVLRKLQDLHERGAQQQRSRIEWRDGATFPFLGDTVILVLDPRATGAVLHSASALPGVAYLTLHLGLPQEAAPEQIRDLVHSWLQRQARRIFEERCNLYAQRLGVRFTRLSLSSAQTRWGSASADGSIRLHWRLVHSSLAIIDYVVTHELAHLREMNHSPRFWDVVRSVLPDYETQRGALRAQVFPQDA